MAIFRIEKTRDYTVMSNHHLKSLTLSLKAKGLLSQILSLPENWNYTLAGLAQINKESVDAIRSAIRELEQAGYIIREQTRDENGSFARNEYVVYEQPTEAQPPSEQQPPPPRSKPKTTLQALKAQPLLENPTTVDDPLLGNPITAFPTSGFPVPDLPLSENPTQLSIDISSKNKSSIDASINPSINQGYARTEHRPGARDWMDEMEQYREIIKENIEYDIMLERFSRESLDELVETMLEAVCSRKDYIRVAGSEIPAAAVKNRLLRIDPSHIEYVFESLHRNTTKVFNIKSYLLTTLYNAPSTMDSYYRAEVNHDLYGNR